MALSQEAQPASSNLERPNLNDLIAITAAKRNKDPHNTLANVDFSNVSNWELYESVQGTENVEIKQRVSTKSLADYLKFSPFVAESRIFMPKVYLDAKLIDPVTDWTLANYSQLFNNREFNCNDDELTYGVKLGLALDKYYRMLDSKQRDLIQNETREQIQSVIRAAFAFNNAAIFSERGSQVYSKNEIIRDKTLMGDATHRKVVKKLRDMIQVVEVQVDRLAANLTMLKEEGPNKTKMEEELWDLQRNLMKMRAVVEKDVSQFRKCDLDSYIVAESLAPDTVEAFDTQVFFTGDGDFEMLYRKLAEADVNVIVVSPELYLSKAIINLQVEGVLTTHQPDFVDDIWRPSYKP